MEGAFQRAIRDAFEQAFHAGQDNPLVIGAIPFDLAEPSYLYVPRRYEWRQRPELPGSASSEAVMPHLLDQRSIPDEQGFKAAVTHAIANFRHSDIRKAVLSVSHELRFSAPVDIDRLLMSLRAQNPEGYQFRVPLPDGAELIGVSPELLLRKRGGRIQSNPLAGSAKRQPHPDQDRAAAERLERSPKDQYEHRLVVDEVRRVLEPHCLELDIPEQPSLLGTPALWHLSTQVDGLLWDARTTVLQLACRLHPTPAVCGFPTERARKLINLVEPFERGVFTGMVGWCDANGDGEWVVTIRCGTVKRDIVRLFAGAGIVEASEPEAEWAEIQAKLSTMLSACGLRQRTEAGVAS
ncbi:isochorismate synthase MenF [Telmatospirillum sp. J64-1]|uniref:isochorismate synthase n=1 Tax=Telmatospirillum sp. J64-1 TaxID=2502183 RepID=UPI001C8F7CB9|nr:isochorismate synthase [Telmatospirillum sp. J64-1]